MLNDNDDFGLEDQRGLGGTNPPARLRGDGCALTASPRLGDWARAGRQAGRSKGAPPGRRTAAEGAGPGFPEAVAPPRARARAPRRPAHARGREGARPGGGSSAGRRRRRRVAEGRLAARAVAVATGAWAEWVATKGAEGGEGGGQ